MTEKTARLIRAIYGGVLTAAAIIAGICLMGACLGIYRSGGEQLFTPEKVAAAFSAVTAPVYVFLALTTGAFLLEAVLPPRPRAKNAANPSMLHARLAAGADMTYCGPQLKAAILRHQKQRRAVTATGFGILGICTAVFLCYALNSSHFHATDINGSMLRAMAWMLPCLAVPFLYAVFAAYFCKKSLVAECALLKTVPKAKEPAPAKLPSGGWVKWVVLGAAAAVLLYGFFAGGTADVLTKAINICTECVGLG